MPAMYVDFNTVDPKHHAIDERARNWAAWCVTNSRSSVQPCFRLYRSDEHWDHSQDQQRPLPIDPIDAQKIEKAVSKLPDKHRTAIRWCYIIRSQPIRMCKLLGVSRRGLADLIWESRVMLLNRRC